MSTRQTSGLVSRASDRAEAPSAASATTSMSDSADSTMRNPARTRC